MINLFSYLRLKLKDYIARREKRKILIREAAERALNLKDFKGPDYTKIKFDVELTDYQYAIVLKIIEQIKDFDVKNDKLEEYWRKYHLPIPVKPVGFEDLLISIDSHSFICIQDNKAKRHIDYFNHRHYMPSLLMNEHIRVLNEAIGKFRSITNPDGENIRVLSQTLSQTLVLLNSNISQFLLNNNFELGNELSLEEVSRFYPIRGFIKDAKALHSNINSVLDLKQLKPEELPLMAISALNAYLIMEKQFCAFTALCGLMLDAAAGTEGYFKPLRNIENVIRLLFQDSELYRLEFPASQVDTTVAIGSRGPKSHTTIMKLYLIDKYDNRVILRIDLPHVRSDKFHFNILSPDDNRYNDLNHNVIDSSSHDDSLIQVLDIFKASIFDQMPNLCIVEDTCGKDEKLILEEMEKMIIYRHLCLNYILNKDYNKQYKKVAGFLRMPGDCIEKIIEEAAKKFSV